MTEVTSPNLLDYLTAGIIANAFPLLWSYATYYIPILGYVAFLVYMVGSGLAAHLLCYKANKDYTVVGLKSTIVSWLTTMFVQYNLMESQGPIFALILFGSYAAGGYIGTYLYQKWKLKEESQKQLETTDEDIESSDSLPDDEKKPDEEQQKTEPSSNLG